MGSRVQARCCGRQVSSQAAVDIPCRTPASLSRPEGYCACNRHEQEVNTDAISQVMLVQWVFRFF